MDKKINDTHKRGNKPPVSELSVNSPIITPHIDSDGALQQGNMIRNRPLSPKKLKGKFK